MPSSNFQKIKPYRFALPRTVAGIAVLASLALVGGGCSHSPGDVGKAVSTPPPAPTAMPLPANLPPDQVARIRQQQAQAQAQAQVGQQETQADMQRSRAAQHK